MDYHSIGFRECAAEVARYMVTVEGLDIQDPLRLRLMSHLQCYAAQRELATKQATTSWGWSSSGSSPAPSAPTTYPTSGGSPSISGFQGHVMPHHPPHGHPPAHHPIGLDQSHGMSAFSAPTSSNNDVINNTPTSSCSITPGSQMSQIHRLPTAGSGAPHVPQVSMATASSQSHTNYHLNLNTFPTNTNLSPPNILGNPGGINPGYHAGGGGIQASAAVKPYRPWGTEIAY